MAVEVPAQRPSGEVPVGAVAGRVAQRLRPGSMWVWLLGAGGFAVGYGLFGWVPVHHQACRYLPASSHCTYFSNISQFHTWIALVGAQTALWAAILPGLWGATRELRMRVSKPDRSRVWSVYVCFSVFVLAAQALLVRLLQPLPPVIFFEARVAVLTLLGLVTVAPAAVGMWLILIVLRSLHERVTEAGQASGAVAGTEAATIVDMRRILKLVVSYVGAVIGSVAFSTGALRNAVLAWDRMSFKPSGPPAGGFDFPPEFVLLFAVFFVVLLGLVYVPVYLELERTGREVLEAVSPVDWTTEPGTDWYAKRQALADFLQLGIRLEESLRAGVAILAPLVGLLLSTFLPGPKA